MQGATEHGGRSHMSKITLTNFQGLELSGNIDELPGLVRWTIWGVIRNLHRDKL
jgi:hypothetical protein